MLYDMSFFCLLCSQPHTWTYKIVRGASVCRGMNLLLFVYLYPRPLLSFIYRLFSSVFVLLQLAEHILYEKHFGVSRLKHTIQNTETQAQKPRQKKIDINNS